MATLSVGNVHVNAPLSNLAQLYRPLLDGFIADEVCPRISVVHESDLYYVWQQADFFGVDVSDLTADRAAPREVDVTATTSSYVCERRELAFTVSDRERGNADNQLRLEQVKQQNALTRLMLLREARVAALLKISTTTTVINGEPIVGGIDSNMTAAANPKFDVATTTWVNFTSQITAGIRKMRQTTGMAPNTLIIPAYVAEGMNSSIIFSSAGGPLNTYTGTPDNNQFFQQYPLLPTRILGMRVLVPGNIQNTAKEGQSASYSDIWGKDVVLAYVTPGPALESPSLAYTFTAEPRQTRATRKDIERVDWFAVGETSVEKAVSPLAGYTITAAAT
jgi:hypothetical protein